MDLETTINIEHKYCIPSIVYYFIACIITFTMYYLLVNNMKAYYGRSDPSSDFILLPIISSMSLFQLCIVIICTVITMSICKVNYNYAWVFSGLLIFSFIGLLSKCLYTLYKYNSKDTSKKI